MFTTHTEHLFRHPFCAHRAVPVAHHSLRMCCLARGFDTKPDATLEALLMEGASSECAAVRTDPPAMQEPPPNPEACTFAPLCWSCVCRMSRTSTVTSYIHCVPEQCDLRSLPVAVAASASFPSSLQAAAPVCCCQEGSQSQGTLAARSDQEEACPAWRPVLCRLHSLVLSPGASSVSQEGWKQRCWDTGFKVLWGSRVLLPGAPSVSQTGGDKTFLGHRCGRFAG